MNELKEDNNEENKAEEVPKNLPLELSPASALLIKEQSIIFDKDNEKQDINISEQKINEHGSIIGSMTPRVLDCEKDEANPLQPEKIEGIDEAFIHERIDEIINSKEKEQSISKEENKYINNEKALDPEDKNIVNEKNSETENKERPELDNKNDKEERNSDLDNKSKSELNINDDKNSFEGSNKDVANNDDDKEENNSDINDRDNNSENKYEIDIINEHARKRAELKKNDNNCKKDFTSKDNNNEDKFELNNENSDDKLDFSPNEEDKQLDLKIDKNESEFDDIRENLSPVTMVHKPKESRQQFRQFSLTSFGSIKDIGKMDLLKRDIENNILSNNIRFIVLQEARETHNLSTLNKLNIKRIKRREIRQQLLKQKEDKISEVIEKRKGIIEEIKKKEETQEEKRV